MSELIEKKGGTFTLLRPLEKKPEKRTKPRGTITFSRFDIIKEYTFIDYLKGKYYFRAPHVWMSNSNDDTNEIGGLQMGMVVAIDYTGSNGNPEDSTSLHVIIIFLPILFVWCAIDFTVLRSIDVVRDQMNTNKQSLPLVKSLVNTTRYGHQLISLILSSI
jgi:hypothetical protein